MADLDKIGGLPVSTGFVFAHLFIGIPLNTERNSETYLCPLGYNKDKKQF